MRIHVVYYDMLSVFSANGRIFYTAQVNHKNKNRERGKNLRQEEMTPIALNFWISQKEK